MNKAEREALRALLAKRSESFVATTVAVEAALKALPALLDQVDDLEEKMGATAAECAQICEEQAVRLEQTDERGEIWKNGKAMAAGAKHCAIYVKAAHTDAYATLAERDALKAEVERLKGVIASDRETMNQWRADSRRGQVEAEHERDQARARVAELSGNCTDCGGWSPTGCHVCITRGQEMAQRIATLEAALHDIAAQWSNVAQHGGTAVASSMARTAREVLAPGWGSKLDAVLAPAVTKEAG